MNEEIILEETVLPENATETKYELAPKPVSKPKRKKRVRKPKSVGAVWWDSTGSKLLSKGAGQVNVIQRAGQVAGKTPTQIKTIMNNNRGKPVKDICILMFS